MGETTYRVVNALGRGAIRALGMRVHWSGLEHLPEEGPVLLAATHVSFLDFLLLEHAALEQGRFLRFLTRHDVWDVPLVGAAMTAMRHVPVDRAAPAGAYLEARRLLVEGEAVCVFPEAGLSHSYTVRPLMRGAVALARETGVPVLPVALWGPQRIWSVGRTDARGRKPRPDLTRGRRVDVSIGAPLHVAPDDDPVATTHVLGSRLTAMLEGLQSLPEHRPAAGEHAPWYPAHLGGHAPTRGEAASLDLVPRAAVRPTWGPDCDGLAASPATPAGW
ncbi:1-acyl-sn-glycerol-3-phosphate acyltransferase [Nocardioides sp. J2M5]|uniref:lysophospholipid acyltransferase family protein n=1 Tax=Nocardioides palaemonis TaxID=2829810 RepID=UPI001BABC001|nr:lysophospholipid acyltransferase family protein [Nocardioides palaemonis]MBS2939497.1 1-acyl-sn-glycerol-3-phosphate acyltransferase [Nocardioides palaemonis]